MTILLCFCGASGGSTLFTLRNSYIMELPRCLIICVDMGIPFFGCTVCFNPLVQKLYLRPTLLWESTPVKMADCRASSMPLDEEIKVVSLETLFCGLQYSLGLLELFHGQAVSFGNTVWVMFLDKYPWRTWVALNPEVELLHCMCKGCSYIKLII